VSEEQKELAEESKVEAESLPISVIDEDNHKVRLVMKTLEEWGWHYSIQWKVKFYTEIGAKHHSAVWKDEEGKVKDTKNPFEYYNEILSESLHFYQDAVNSAIRYQDYNFSLRKKIIIFLGCRCLFCGNEDIDYLQLDHKDSDGGKERERFKKRGLNPLLYYWNNLVQAYLRLQVLCIKCHRLKSTYRILQRDIDEKVKQAAEKPAEEPKK
jgi:hypothetical protein